MIQLIWVHTKEELAHEDLAKINFNEKLGQIGYIRCLKSLYYADKNNEDIYSLDWLKMSQENFDRIFKPAKQSRALTERELAQITLHFAHERIEHMHWFRIISSKQYAQEILKTCCEKKIAIENDVFDFIMKKCTQYFIIVNEHTLCVFDMLHEMRQFIDDILFQNAFKKNDKSYLNDALDLIFDLLLKNQIDLVANTFNVEELNKLYVDIFDKLESHYSNQENSVIKINLCRVQKIFSFAKKFEDTFDLQSAYESTILKDKLLYYDGVHEGFYRKGKNKKFDAGKRCFFDFFKAQGDFQRNYSVY